MGSTVRVARTVKDELRENLICLLENGAPLFPGIVGYEDTVVPQLVNALLSRHNFILLGLRGQAKSRILRALVDAAWMKRCRSLAGSEVNDNPFAPISKYGRELLAERGDDDTDRLGAARFAVRREARHARRDHRGHHRRRRSDPGGARRALLSDELTMHFGMLPRANRGIFAINELPDLVGQDAGRACSTSCRKATSRSRAIRCASSSTWCWCFTANPEDYTARGKIITPLKDRIGSEIVTHYPHTVELGSRDHEAGGVDRRATAAGRFRLPDFIAELVERVAFEARDDKRVDRRSGVSQRLPISLLENVVSNAERRALATREKTGRAARVRRVRGAARDHRQDRAGVRRRAARRGVPLRAT